MEKKLGEPLFTKIQNSVKISITKRKVAGFKFVFKLYFIEDQLVHFESECRNNSKTLQKALLDTVIQKHNCDLEVFSFNQNCAVKVTKIFNVRVQFFSINRKHIEMMKSFKEKNSNSYTYSLFLDGIKEMAKKVTEEAGEVAISAVTDDGRVKEESADLIYHLLVMLRKMDVSFDEVLDVLEARSTK